MSSQVSVQMRVDVGLRPRNINPHTFIYVTHPDGRQTEYGLIPSAPSSPSSPGKIEVTGPGSEVRQSSSYDLAGPKVPLTDQQYRDLMREIESATTNPPDYILPGSWWPSNDGTNCTGWAVDIWNKIGLPEQFGVTNGWVWNPIGQAFNLKLNEWFTRAKNWVWPRDPLILDLDNNGLDTVGLNANIHFDHDGDGVLTKTGWSGKNDALLVWDRNANGTIDTGAELFGDFTALPNGTLAPNGFAALAALDTNGDGILDATDPAFANLKLWRDASQDGVSQSGEFITLAEAGIVSLNLANTLKNRAIGNGNMLAREGSFTRVDGTVGGMGEFNFATDTFDTRFADTITVPAALQSLPNMGGSGNVRDLHQAAAQSAAVAELLTQFKAAPTRAEQMALLDQLVTAWADTAGMAGTLEERIAGAYRIQYDFIGNQHRVNNFDAAALVAAANGLSNSSLLMSDAGNPIINAHYHNVISEWSRKLAVLEAFKGQYFFNLSVNKSQIDGANDSLWECAA